MLGDWAIHADKYGSKARGLMIRRTRKQLVDTIERAKELYLLLGAEWKEQDKEFVMPGGAILRMAYLESDKDAENYQGHAYTRVYVEELTNFPNPAPVRKLKATLRSAHGVPVGFRATCNPGGPGHVWVKETYIDPNPKGFEIFKVKDTVEIDGEMVEIERDRVFIPAKLTDNPILLRNDPGYVLNLKESGTEQLVRAWLDGDWNIVEGAFFDCWSSKMVIRPFAVPDDWLRFRSFDWGSARPFSVGWWAISDGQPVGSGIVYPKGAMIRYREWYGVARDNNGLRIANTGLKLTAEQIGLGIKEREAGEKITYGVADPAAFAQDGGPSHIERMYKAGGVIFRKADNKRVATVGHMGGWDMMRQRMIGEEDVPMIYCFETCEDSIRTIPSLQHDEARPEDLDTDGEDHAADEWRYGCMSRPWVARKPQHKPPPMVQQAMMNDIWKTQTPRSKRI